MIKKSNLTIPQTFTKANMVKSKKRTNGSSEKITIVCIATKKDFTTLPDVLSFAVKAVGQSNLVKIQIVVPEKHYLEATLILNGLLPVEFDIKTDEVLISDDQIELVRHYFGNKSSWIIQQVLKFEAVRSINTNTLILDADTLIISNSYLRVIDGIQPLNPTEEFHKPYYDFLAKISPIFSNITNSFVPHHQIVQKDIFKEMCYSLNVNSLETLIALCIKNADISEPSPLCIDYEMYAQYLFIMHPHRYSLVKWSNISISNNKFNLYAKNRFFYLCLENYIILLVSIHGVNPFINAIKLYS